MRTKIILLAYLLSVFLVSSCKKDSTDESQPSKIEVIANHPPIATDKYLRICYMLKMWEFRKDKLMLKEIIVLDNDTKTELMTIGEESFGYFISNPPSPLQFLEQDQISSYYLSVQLPLPLGQPAPSKVIHRFILQDTLTNAEVVVEGGLFSPRINESPLAISSPVKGTSWMFLNLSTMGYHYNSAFFVDGQIFTGDQFAFDNVQMDSAQYISNGDLLNNQSYYCYADTLYAVANGSVVALVDGRPENSGNAKDIVIGSLDEYGGNYLFLDLGGQHYALYAHCVPYSFFVKNGDVVKEGQPLALLGNSGNSTGPHLHFQICDNADALLSKGLPFVIKK